MGREGRPDRSDGQVCAPCGDGLMSGSDHRPAAEMFRNMRLGCAQTQTGEGEAAISRAKGPTENPVVC